MQLVLSLSMLLSTAGAFAASEGQTVYINLSQIMQESQAGREASAVLEKLRASKAEDINKKVKTFESAKVELQKASNEYEAKKNLLKDVKSEEKKLTDLSRKVAKCEAELKESAEDAEKDFRAEYVRVSEQLLKDQIDVVTEWAKEKKVLAVIDTESGRVLYRRDDADATKDMLLAVNKKHEQKALLAKNKATPASTPATTAKTA